MYFEKIRYKKWGRLKKDNKKDFVMNEINRNVDRIIKKSCKIVIS